MEQILIFECPGEEKIRAAAARMSVSVSKIVPSDYGFSLHELSEGKRSKAKKDVPALPKSLILFCSLTEGHLDDFLEEMKKQKIRAEYKAVLTPSNASWTPFQLFMNLVMERMSLESGHSNH